MAEKVEVAKPLCIEMREAKQELIDAINQVMFSHHLPAYILRYIAEEILNTIKEVEQKEIATAEAQYNEALNTPLEK